MALYSCSISNIKRGDGRSSVAKAAYNSRSLLLDERTANQYNYSQKSDLGFSEIIAPENAPFWTRDRQQLWSKNELANKRRDARVAKEILVALPRELDKVQQLSLVRSFVSNNLTPLGVVADVNAHELEPNKQDDWNPHVHILISTQHLVDGEFGSKITELNKKDFVTKIRVAWAEHTNLALSAAGSLERVDHRSNFDRGIDRTPQIHLGHKAWAMKLKSIATERGDRYAEIQERNQQIDLINAEVSGAIEHQVAQARQSAQQSSSTDSHSFKPDLHSSGTQVYNPRPNQTTIDRQRDLNGSSQHKSSTDLHNKDRYRDRDPIGNQPLFSPESPPNRPGLSQKDLGSTHDRTETVNNLLDSYPVDGSDVIKNSMPESMKAQIDRDKAKPKKRSWWQKAIGLILGNNQDERENPQPPAKQSKSITPRPLTPSPKVKAAASMKPASASVESRFEENPQTKEQKLELARELARQINHHRQINQQLRTKAGKLALLAHRDQITVMALKPNTSRNEQEKLILKRRETGWQITKYELNNGERTRLLQVIKRVEKNKLLAQTPRMNQPTPSSNQIDSPTQHESRIHDTRESQYHEPDYRNLKASKPTKRKSRGIER